MNQGGHSGSTDVTCIILYSFLKNSSDVTFAYKLSSLKKQLIASKQPLSAYDDGELQTDGNSFGRLEDRSLDLDSVTDEETFQKIGMKLAEIGDKLAAEIEPSFVNNLAQQFMAGNVSRQVITQDLSKAVQKVIARMSPEMEQEKAMLVVAMVLAKKVANVAPAALQQVFETTVNYINQNLHDYVNNLERED